MTDFDFARWQVKGVSLVRLGDKILGELEQVESGLVIGPQLVGYCLWEGCGSLAGVVTVLLCAMISRSLMACCKSVTSRYILSLSAFPLVSVFYAEYLQRRVVELAAVIQRKLFVQVVPSVPF